MSYIINHTSPFVSVKLTDKGREKLAKGQLNFSFWAIGDSEINYNRESIVDANQGDSVLSASTSIQRPKDRQPNFRSYITTGGTSVFNPITNANIKTVKVVVNNEATERGFFSGDTSIGFTTLTGSPYTVTQGVFSDTDLTGGTSFDVGVSLSGSVGNLMLIKLSNSVLGDVALNTNDEPIPHLWYKIQSVSGTSVIVDRPLPNLSSGTGTTLQYIIYNNGEVYDTIGSATTTSYWDSGTLCFNSSCDVSASDVPVWNQNNVWCEDLLGITGTSYEGYTRFGSYTYLGQKYPYFGYSCGASSADTAFSCEGESGFDQTNKSIAIIHYTNNTISNFYGEFLYVNDSTNKTVTIELPTLMYHRRNFSGGTSTGDKMGMTFVASGGTKFIDNTDIEYVDLIEMPSMVDGAPLTVGKVFTQLKMIVIDDDEIVSALSYKSNRNWTLPSLNATLVKPSGGTSTGILTQNKTMYLTYALNNSSGSGLTETLPAQNFAKVTNTTSISRDIQFKLEDTNLLPYMRKIEDGSYDGKGFYGDEFKILYQIVDDEDERPSANAWKVVDFTNTGLTTNVGETIDPNQLENQLPSVNGFVLNLNNGSGATTFDITQPLGMPPVLTPEILQFGDERFFYGNIKAFIGATIYKTIFDIRVNAGQFKTTTNPTREINSNTNPPKIRISEVGIYDSSNELVIVGKLSQPIQLSAGNTIMLELSIDF